MFGTIRKHQTWLWAVIITLTIISFVIFFSPYSKLNNVPGGRGNYGSINGEKISPEDFAKAQREVYLSYFFTHGAWPDDDSKKAGFDPMRETYQWLLLIQKEENMKVHVSSEMAAQAAREMVRHFEKAGTPDVFLKQVLQPRGFQADDLERYLRHYLGVQQLIGMVGISGKLVTPQEAQGLYERENQQLSTSIIYFDSSNYLSKVTVTPEAIPQFYSNRLSVYRVPERIQVTYVRFGISNYLAKAEEELSKTNLSEIVDANYQRLGTNYFKDAKTPAEAKAKIREEIIRSAALTQARRQAAEFAGPLFDKEPAKAENLEAMAKEKGLPVQVSPPFDREGTPAGLDVGPDFTKQAFARTAAEPFAGPIIGRDGVYVLAVSKRLPSEIPPLDTLRDRVTMDYKLAQAANLARRAGMEFVQTATNALAQGKSFETICSDAKVTPHTLPPFSLSTRTLAEVEDHLNLNQLKQIAFSTPPGKLSSFQPTGEGGVVLYVKEKLPLDNTKMQSDLPNFVNYVRQTRQNEAFNDWFRKEAEKALRDTPLARQQQPSLTSGAAGAKS